MDPAYIQVAREAVGKVLGADQADKKTENREKPTLQAVVPLESIEIRQAI
jgi:hypothetical protein